MLKALEMKCTIKIGTEEQAKFFGEEGRELGEGFRLECLKERLEVAGKEKNMNFEWEIEEGVYPEYKLQASCKLAGIKTISGHDLTLMNADTRQTLLCIELKRALISIISELITEDTALVFNDGTIRKTEKFKNDDEEDEED